MTKRPTYLQDVDDALDALNEAAGDGLTIAEISKKTGISYGQVQQATVRLRNDDRVNFEREGRTIRFWAR